MSQAEAPVIIKPNFKITNFLSKESRSSLIHEIFSGLTAEQKYISSRFFYDKKGSALFEEITKLPEYYPTRTEKSILSAHAKEILGDLESLVIIELGSGDCSKISILFDKVPEQKIGNIKYIPVDVSESAILQSAEILSSRYEGLKIHGLLADFLKHLDLLPGATPRLICFFGSTLGNLSRNQATDFLWNLKNIMGPGDRLLLGLDRVKDPEILYKAYNDKQGITAQFNRNILNVVNDVSGTNFKTSDFEHLAFYNEKENRIEMHLKALNNMRITSKHFPDDIFIVKGETIHTENSHKFLPEQIEQLALSSGLKFQASFTDVNKYFSLNLFEYPNLK